MRGRPTVEGVPLIFEYLLTGQRLHTRLAERQVGQWLLPVDQEAELPQPGQTEQQQQGVRQ